jgi:hypothetical protein
MRCEGCKDYTGCPLHVSGSVAINECPCADCMVKVICEQPCDALDKHYFDVYKTVNRK